MSDEMRIPHRPRSLPTSAVNRGPVNLGPVNLGPVQLVNPIVCASGTFGHGGEFARLNRLEALGAVTVKSLAHFAHDGNPPLRTTEVSGGGMLNSVGLAGPGVGAWIEHDLPTLSVARATTIVSVWGRSVDDYARAAAMLAPVADRIAALEINLSCPNIGSHVMFAQSAELTRATVAATIAVCDLPVFAKLTAQVTDLAAIAGAALDAGATGLTLINTMPGLAVDIAARAAKLGAGGGGVSGPPLHAIALRSVWDVARAFPGTPIIGTGGVTRGTDAVAMLLAGATAVGVGTATFADPRAPSRIRDELDAWCADRNVRNYRDLVGRMR